MKREQAHQMLAEFARELRQLLQRYPQVAIKRADGYFTDIIVTDDDGSSLVDDRGAAINKIERVHCSELIRESDECTEPQAEQ